MSTTNWIRIPVVVAVAFVALSNLAQSDTPNSSLTLGPWAGDLTVGPGMDAHGRNLRGSQFVGQDLRGANFEGCDLYGVLFWSCKLWDVSFKGASLMNAVFEECDPGGVKGADFTDAVIVGLKADSSVPLSEHQLKSTRSYKIKDLQGCTLCVSKDNESGTRPKFDFRKARMANATLDYGDFRDCDFTNATIDHLNIDDDDTITFQQLASTSNYKRRDLRYMRLRNTLADADLSGVDLTGTDFSCSAGHASFKDAIITECKIRGGFTKENLYSTKSYQQGHLSKVAFIHIDASGWNLSCQNLTGCYFSGCNLSDTNFEDAVITKCCFRNVTGKLDKDGRFIQWNTNGPTVEQIKSTWNYKHQRMEGVLLPKEIADALKSDSAKEQEAVLKQGG